MILFSQSKILENPRKSDPFPISDPMNFVVRPWQLFITNLSRGRIGEDNATLLGSLLISQFQLAAIVRAYVPEEDRRPFYFLSTNSKILPPVPSLRLRPGSRFPKHGLFDLMRRLATRRVISSVMSQAELKFLPSVIGSSPRRRS